jgi:hypothetical protein
MALSGARWEELLACSDEFTCYSAAVATWLAMVEDDWGRLVSAGLWLTLTEQPDRLFGFGYFRPGRRAELGLVRIGADEGDAAIEGVLAELERRGRVIIAGDGFRLPWHVAHGRVHTPHWYVLLEGTEGLEVADPFACRNELGVQRANRQPIERAALEHLLIALPGGDPVHRLREVLALGDEAETAVDRRFQWFVNDDVGDWRRPAGSEGPAALELLGRHFREHGQDATAYKQVDDIWSIARHRTFLARRAAADATCRCDTAISRWVDVHAAPLAKRWGHIAPLLMQATLALGAGRPASASVPDTLAELAEREREAAAALPSRLDPGSI